MTATPPLLDFDALTAPVPGDKPAGESVPFNVREQLEDDRKEDDPTLYTDDDPMRPEKFKKADWADIIRLTKETLTTTSKDLLLTARLTEALVKQHGFPGLRDGLHLLRLLVENCWDRLNPPIEAEDDIEMRAGPFHWLDDPDRGARFPNTLRAVPVVFGEGVQYGWMEWNQTQDGKGQVPREEFEKAILATPLERCEAAVEALSKSHEELGQLVQVLSAKMGPVAPALTGLRQAVDDCRMFVQQIYKRKAPAGDEQKTQGEAAEGKTVSAPGKATAANRDEAYRQLAHAAAVLQQLEPHSPIPYLVQRAVELGALPFPQLMKALIRDTNVLSEMNRELGIKTEENPS